MIGGDGDNNGKGAVWVFVNSAGTWSQQGNKLIGTGAVGYAEQGKSIAVSADGNTMIEGGLDDNSNAGAVWVFTRSGTTWTQQGTKLTGTGAVGNAQQGISVGLSADGNTAIIGGNTDNSDIGSSWVFTRSGTTWTQRGSKLPGAGEIGNAYRGISAAMSADGTTAITGGIGDNQNAGAAWIYSIPSVCDSTFSSTYDTICSSALPFTWNGLTFTTAGTKTATLTNAGGCDSIATLSLTVHAVVRDSFSHSICTGSSYTFNGHTLTTAGTYSDTLTTSGGCDSIVTLRLSVAPILRDTFSRTICTGGTYGFGGHTLATAGTYSDTLTTGGGCDSISTLVLSLAPVLRDSFSHSICTGGTYSFNGHTLSSVGTYSDTLITGGGCDSIVTVTLSISPILRDSFLHSICPGGTYSFGGHTLSSAGVYSDTLASSGGCDSVVTVTLSIAPIVRDSFSQGICTGGTYSFGGHTLSSAGVYSDTLTSSGGCDSIVTVTLSVYPTYAQSLADTICMGAVYPFYGHSLTAAGTYTDTLSTVHGCDSIITLHLALRPGLATSIADTLCIGSTYDFNGNILSVSGVYTDTLTSVSGCDSVVTLALGFVSTLSTSVSASICLGSTYDFHNHILSSPGTYTDTLISSHGCDSVVTLHLSVFLSFGTNISNSICQGATYNFNGHPLTMAGTYTDTLPSTQGCDSIVTLTLTVNPAPVATFTPADTQVCTNCHGGNATLGLSGGAPSGGYYIGQFVSGDSLVIPFGTNRIFTVSYVLSNGSGCSDTVSHLFRAFTEEGIDQVGDIGTIRVYPNPNNGSFIVEAMKLSGADLSIYDIYGQKVYAQRLAADKTQISDMNLASGVYFITVSDTGMIQTIKIQIVRE